MKIKDGIRNFARVFLRQIRRARCYLKIGFLKLKGVEVSWHTLIHPDALFELGDGRIVIGKRTYIDKGVILRSFDGFIVIGSDCSINGYSILSGAGGIEIGDAVRIASHTVIVASNHNFDDRSLLIKDQGISKKGIQIESDVWVGAGARVLDGVKISQGSVIAAGTVVTKSTSPYSVSAGVPGREIGSRK